MTYDSQSLGRGPGGAFDPELHPELYEGVPPKRIIAFIIDAIIVFLLMIPAVLVVLVLGLITLGLGWLLLPPLFAIVALGYVALTLGSPRSATLGMRAMGIEMRTGTGTTIYPVLAAVHALLFWVSVSLLTPLILLVALFSTRQRLLHDILLGTVMLNSAPLHRLEGRLQGGPVSATLP